MWRNEKPGPGRYREFTQCDADTVGSASPSADAELLMMCTDSLEALGLKRGDYIVKLNNRKLLDGVLEASGVGLEDRTRRKLLRPFPDPAVVARLLIETIVFWAVHRHWDSHPQVVNEAVAKFRIVNRARQVACASITARGQPGRRRRINPITLL